MIIRCKSCQGTIWLQTDQKHSATVACKQCGQEYRFQAWEQLRSAERRLSENARRLAREENIDLPGAYSVLLGIMQVNEVRELGDHASTACRTTAPSTGAPPESPPDEPQGSSHSFRYDPAFRAAVEEGLLTPRQAMERGKRDTYAGLVSNKHGLPMEKAYDVADNRLSLLEALRRRTAAPPQAVGVRLRPNWTRFAVWCAVALIPVGLVTAHFSGGGIDAGVPDSHGVPTIEFVGEVELRADDRGRVVQVLGPDPLSVLKTYCDSGLPGGPFQPLKVVPSRRPGTRSRVGLLRNPRKKLLAITIQEDRERNRWVAGDGRGPLVPKRAPDGAEVAVQGL